MNKIIILIILSILTTVFLSCTVFAKDNSELSNTQSYDTTNSASNTRSIRDFTYKDNIFIISDSWAKSNGYRIINSSGENLHIYKRGYGLAHPPIICQIEQNDNEVHLEAYVKVGLLGRITTLFITPSEMNLTSEGFIGSYPRTIGRTDINSLLYIFNAKQIY